MNQSSLIPVSDSGEFTCNECENTSPVETSTPEGIVVADVQNIIDTLTAAPSTIAIGICPICGMEYLFKMQEGELFLEPSDMNK
jgi:hypothetical protein